MLSKQLKVKVSDTTMLKKVVLPVPKQLLQKRKSTILSCLKQASLSSNLVTVLHFFGLANSSLNLAF
ncbi:MAG: hypothetical protein JWR18_1668 [Segetibacter sp.]|jgi:hypothetical protein|nr:hypothetical protein [Segetibacter sp.]